MNKEELESAFNETTDNAVKLLKENAELKKENEKLKQIIKTIENESLKEWMKTTGEGDFKLGLHIAYMTVYDRIKKLKGVLK
jgi:regulator of replication initiation timing